MLAAESCHNRARFGKLEQGWREIATLSNQHLKTMHPD
jgi:hypothetical protein